MRPVESATVTVWLPLASGVESVQEPPRLPEPSTLKLHEDEASTVPPTATVRPVALVG